ncbi:MAG: XisI protein [Phaeodactylibacter sp.]|nr:XisI protein [Phaeodactylibacter sp.]
MHYLCDKNAGKRFLPWLQQNWTDQNVADELTAKGVDRKAIVLGFVPPYERAHTGYA